MSKFLIVYASHYGQTLEIARHLARWLRADDHDVQLADATVGVRRLPLPNAFDVVVLGSRVELGHHARAVEEYIRAHRDRLDRMPTAFFSVSMAAAQRNAGDDPNGYLAQTFARLAWQPTQQIAFAGALPYRRYNWITRLVMKQIARRGGHTTDTTRDQVFTDDRAVEAFAARLSARAERAPQVIRA